MDEFVRQQHNLEQAMTPQPSALAALQLADDLLEYAAEDAMVSSRLKASPTKNRLLERIVKLRNASKLLAACPTQAQGTPIAWLHAITNKRGKVKLVLSFSPKCESSALSVDTQSLYINQPASRQAQEATPLFWTNTSAINYSKITGRSAYVSAKADDVDCIPLYTHPSPSTAADDPNTCVLCKCRLPDAALREALRDLLTAIERGAFDHEACREDTSSLLERTRTLLAGDNRG